MSTLISRQVRRVMASLLAHRVSCPFLVSIDTIFGVVKQETPIFSRHSLPGLVHCAVLRRQTVWSQRENKLVKPTQWKVILQETPIFSRHRLPFGPAVFDANRLNLAYCTLCDRSRGCFLERVGKGPRCTKMAGRWFLTVKPPLLQLSRFLANLY